MKRLPISLALFLTAHAASLRGDELLVVQATVWQSATQLVVDFADDGSGAASDFTVERSFDLSEGSWALYGDVSLAPAGGGWRMTIPVPADGKRGFFRVLKDGELVTAEFGSETATVSEGGIGQGIIVQLSSPFAGTLHYTLDYGDGNGPQPGELFVDGATSATIPVTGLPDDASADALNFVTLRISATGNSYTSVGTGISLIVEDNDAIWAGVLDAGDAKLNIRLLTTDQGGAKAACLKTDGAGFLSANPAGADWPFSALTFTDSVFNGQVGPILIPAEDTVYGEETHITIAISSQFGGGEVDGDKITGAFTMITTVPALPHLSFPTRNGPFVLMKQAQVPKELEPPTTTP